jgi:hypothetical protein
MLRLDKTLLKCDKAGCQDRPHYKVRVESNTHMDAYEAILCPSHAHLKVEQFKELAKKAEQEGFKWEVHTSI